MLEGSRSWSLVSTNCGIRNNSNKTPSHSRIGQKLLPSICVCVCLCGVRVHGAYTKNACECVCRGQRRMQSRCLPSASLPSDGALTEPEKLSDRMDAQRAFRTHLSLPTTPSTAGIQVCTLLMWALGIQIQVLMFLQQAILTTDPFS